jgi:hypothetical protein
VPLLSSFSVIEGIPHETLALHICEKVLYLCHGDCDGVDIIPLFAEAPSWRELV